MSKSVVIWALRACFFMFMATVRGRSQTASDAEAIGLPQTATFYSVGADNINLVNGNVHTAIPLLHLPGRNGLDVDLKMIMDSRSTGVFGNQLTIPYWGSQFGNGIHLAGIPVLTWNWTMRGHDDDAQDNFDGYDDGSQDIYCRDNFQLLDFDGTLRSFTNVTQCNYDASQYEQAETIAVGAQSEFIRLTTPTAAQNYLPNQITAWLSGGRRIIFDATTGAVLEVIDSNGNKITYSPSSNGLIISDTVGRSIVVNSSSTDINPPSGYSLFSYIPLGSLDIAYNDVNGVPQHITLSSSTITNGGPDLSLHSGTCSVPNPNPDNNVNGGFITNSADVDAGSNLTQYTLQFPGPSNSVFYTFTLDSLGELIKVIYPTGGYVAYSYGTFIGMMNTGIVGPSWSCPSATIRELTARRRCTASSGSCTSSTEEVTTYTPTLGQPSGGFDFSTNANIDVLDPLGNKTTYVFSPNISGRSPQETDRYMYSGASNLLKSIHTTYTDMDQYIGIPSTARPSVVTTTDWANGAAVTSSSAHYQYDYSVFVANSTQAGLVPTNVTDTQSWAADGTVLRHETLMWYEVQNSTNFLVTGHMQDKKVSGPANYLEEKYEYDGATQGLASTGAISHENPTTIRGNLTKITDLDVNNNELRHVSFAFDDTGNRVAYWDALSNPIYYSYADTWSALTGGNTCAPSGASFAYVSRITNAANQTTNFLRYSCTGALATTIDSNNQPTSYHYDTMNRMSSVDLPPNITAAFSFSYVDSGRWAASRSQKLNVSETMSQQVIFDGIGRPTQSSITSATGGPVIVDMVYDPLDRASFVSNPYQSTPGGGVQYQYDGLGRKILQTQPDGSLLHWCYSGATNLYVTSCPANASGLIGVTWINSFDESGVISQHVSDAVGHLVASVEDNPSSTSLGLVTVYGYDVFGNLIGGTQYGTGAEIVRSRFFSYDSLSRLITASNPETGTICYGTTVGAVPTPTNCTSGYDGNGNLRSRTDARGAVTHYTFDVLNRLLSKTYSSGTASSCYQYDSSSVAGAGGNLIGRLTNKWTQPGTCPVVPPAIPLTLRSYLSYDAMGRLLNDRQCTRSNCGTASYSPSYTYDLAGHIVTHSNGTGAFTFTDSYDAAGRLVSVVSSNTQYTSNLFTVPTSVSVTPCNSNTSGQPQTGYSPAGALMNATFGNYLQLNRGYDTRLRTVCETDTGSSVPTATPGAATITIVGFDQTH